MVFVMPSLYNSNMCPLEPLKRVLLVSLLFPSAVL